MKSKVLVVTLRLGGNACEFLPLRQRMPLYDVVAWRRRVQVSVRLTGLMQLRANQANCMQALPQPMAGPTGLAAGLRALPGDPPLPLFWLGDRGLHLHIGHALHTQQAARAGWCHKPGGRACVPWAVHGKPAARHAQ